MLKRFARFVVVEDQSVELPPLEERPLVTFALFAYNQEEYIREAMEGAFSQTYEPLEIILSDDCSTDRTFSIMDEMARNYSGPHKIILRKNNINLNIGRHVSTVAKLSNGKYLVFATGDDISAPDRVNMTVSYFENNKDVLALFSDIYAINSSGTTTALISVNYEEPTLTEAIKNFAPQFLGCSAAYSRILFDNYPDLNENLIYEDRVLPLRAQYLGKTGHIPARLVKYREHSTNVHNNSSRKKMSISIATATRRRDLKNLLTVTECYRADILTISDKIERERLTIALKTIETLQEKIFIEISSLSTNLRTRIIAASQSKKFGYRFFIKCLATVCNINGATILQKIAGTRP